MTFDEANKLNEELELVKFRYYGDNIHDKKPKVLVIDAEYPGMKGQKTYGQRKDVLGINLNYCNRNERKKLQRDMSKIDLFSDFLQADKLERYTRLKDLCPEKFSPFIRRYKKSSMKNTKVKRGLFYHHYSFTDKDEYFKDEV